MVYIMPKSLPFYNQDQVQCEKGIPNIIHILWNVDKEAFPREPSWQPFREPVIIVT